MVDDFCLIEIVKEALPARHHRISMGVQTFDRRYLESMGRQGFGDADDVAKITETAHRMGMTVSGDLLINLPSQTEREIIADVEKAIAIGLDQVCIYHLVLFEGIGTAWSKDSRLLKTLPGHKRAMKHWRTAREAMLAAGFEQTTLTNFERADVARSGRGFAYERHSFTPDQYDAVGFGPAAISTFVGDSMSGAVKPANAGDSSDYVAAVRETGNAWAHRFEYSEQDLRLLFVTRSIPSMRVSRPAYRAVFGTDLVGDFSDVLAAVDRQRLVEIDASGLDLTERGMLFADSIAGLFASRRAQQIRLSRRALSPEDGEAVLHHMG